jgi:hypothetical protein
MAQQSIAVGAEAIPADDGWSRTGARGNGSEGSR